MKPLPRGAFSWALYDWANSAFATTVMAGFFPLFFKEYWCAGLPAPVSTFRLGAVNSAAGILVALSAPVLGAIADRGRSRKRFLAAAALMGIAATASLALVPRGGWLPAALLYGVGLLGFAGGEIFYDALLPGVSGNRADAVSALGYSLGYLGGGLLFALNVAMTLSPGTFGLPDAATAVRVSFLTVALWWGAFAIPLLRRVPEPEEGGSERGWATVTAGLRQLAATMRELRRHRQAFLLLVAYWVYIDGVDTIIRMAVDYGLSLGFPSRSLITALLVTQFVGFPAALLFGRLGERIGAKRGILIGLGVYLLVTLWGATMTSVKEFYVLAAVIGLVQGGVQSLSRSLYSRLIPADRTAEFFGFYNVMGKFATVLGPVLMGWTALATGSTRGSILSIALLFIVGGALLLRVDEKAGAAA